MSRQNIEAIYPLSPMQEGILFHSLYKPRSGIYTVQLSCPFYGSFNVTAFKRAWQEMLERHAILRTLFTWERRSKPLQIVRSEVDLPWKQLDWANIPSCRQREQLKAFLDEDRELGFELARAPLMRLAVIRLAEDTHQFVWTTHHLLLDGWSSLKVIEEVIALYGAFCSNKDLTLKEPRPYRDYINWLQRQSVSAAEDYWRRALRGFPSATPLPFDSGPEPSSAQAVSDRRQQTYLPAASTTALRSWARKQGLTLNTIMHAAWAFLLWRYSGEQDVLFGTTVSGRPIDLAEADSMVGLFINTLPVRVQVTPGTPLVAWLKALQSQLVEMRQYEYSALVWIAGWSDVPRSQPLFHSILIFENYPMRSFSEGGTLDGFDLKIGDLQITESTNYPLVFMAVPGRQVELRIAYDSRRFNHTTITRMLVHLQTVLEAMATWSEGRVGDLPVLTAPEEHELLVEWNDTHADDTQEGPLHRLFELQVDRAPDAIAVSYCDHQLSYRELERRANQLSNYLRSIGVRPGVLAGICVERSLEMMVGLLGVLKAGGAYVPLDPGYPAERLRLVFEDAQMPILLTQRRLNDNLAGFDGRTLSLDADWETIARHSDDRPDLAVRPEGLAYVIYTSGSTGRPKGVQIEHQSIVNFLDAMRRRPGLAADDVLLAVTTISFDIAGLELFLPLVVGARVAIASREEAVDGRRLLARLRLVEATVMQATPATWRLLLEAGLQPGDRLRIFCGGEALSPELAGQLRSRSDCIWNLYGPTETTVWSVATRVDDEEETVSLGRPICNTHIYILNSDLQTVPIGVVGRLYIGGKGLARGYTNRADQTAERFIPNPFARERGARLYDTGDLASYRTDGAINFLGRVDHQVKIRGFRVELSDIEAVLSQHQGVKHSVVIAREDGSKTMSLVAYWLADVEPPPETSELRGFLKARLPDYMMPSTFVQLDALPLTPNGKVDRRALPAPGQPRAGRGAASARTPIEEVLAGVWGEVLKVENVGAEDNFFELGGHSLLATQLISRVREIFHVELSLQDLFESPTVAGMAGGIQASKNTDSVQHIPSLKPVPRDEGLPLSFAQQRLFFLDQLEPGNAAYNIPAAVRLQGRLSVEALRQGLQEAVNRHEVLRTSFVLEAGRPSQIIEATCPVALPVIDLSHLPPELREARMAEIMAAEARRPFDLACGPSLRVVLLSLQEEDHAMACTMHHIAADGWSTTILIQEVKALYEAYSAGRPSPLQELALQYVDFAAWQRQWLQGSLLEGELAHWRRRLGNNPIAQELPTDRPRSAIQSYKGAIKTVALPAALTATVKALGRTEGCTLFMTLLAAFDTLLHYYTGGEVITVGTDFANRHRRELEGLIGFFANQLVLRTDLSGNPTFRELMRRVRDVALEASAHQDIPFDKLVNELQPDRDLSRNPLFQVMLVLQNVPGADLQLAGLTATPLRVDNQTAKFDLVVFVEETGQELLTIWNYNTDLFDAATIELMMGRFKSILEKVVGEPDARIEMIKEGLTQGERERQALEQRKHEEASFAKFLKAKPKPIVLPQGDLVRTGYLRSGDSTPLVIRPDAPNLDLSEWVKKNSEFVEGELLKHGALLFRGFNIESVARFERVASALCPGLYGDYGDLPREELSKRVYGSTPYPADQPILFHNESSHLRCWPLKIMFFCVQPSEQGGETPIVDCRKIYDLLDPEIRGRFEQKQMMYVRHFIEGLDVSWQDFFGTTERSVVEEHCRRSAIDFEWTENGGLMTRQVRQAVARHPKTGAMVFFNQLQLHHISCLDPAIRQSLGSLYANEEFPRNAYYGDGSLIEEPVVEAICRLYRENSVSFAWERGDLLMLDNMLTAHGRNPYRGQRKIVVAMGELLDAEDLKYGSYPFERGRADAHGS